MSLRTDLLAQLALAQTALAQYQTQLDSDSKSLAQCQAQEFLLKTAVENWDNLGFEVLAALP